MAVIAASVTFWHPANLSYRQLYRRDTYSSEVSIPFCNLCESLITNKIASGQIDSLDARASLSYLRNDRVVHANNPSQVQCNQIRHSAYDLNQRR
jgi:hypothetical protein